MVRKHSRLLAGIVILAAALALAADGEWKSFSCAEGKFTLELPPGWQQLKKIPDTLFAAAGAQQGPEDKFIENLTVVTMANVPPRTLDDFMDAYLRSVPAAVDGYQFISRGELTIDGRPGGKIVFLQTLEGEQVKVMQALSIKGGLVYILTYTDSPATFDPRQPDFERSASSLRFE